MNVDAKYLDKIFEKYKLFTMVKLPNSNNTNGYASIHGCFL